MKRNITRAFCFVAVFVGVLGFALPANALEFGARGYYWFPGLKGDLRGDNAGVAGTQVDIKDDLGMDNKNIPSAEIYVGTKRHHFSLMYSQVDFSGSQAINRNITFRGNTFAAGAQVDSDLKLKMVDLDYQYDLINLENILAGFSLGPVLKVKYLDGEARLNSTTPGSAYDRKETFSVPVPMIGLGAHLGVLANWLEARAKVTGIAYSGSAFYDAMADISLTPFPFVDIHGGYRYVKLKVDNVSDIFANVELSGPFVALTIGF